MELKNKVRILFFLSGLETVLLITGLILANIYLIFLAILVLLVQIPIVYASWDTLDAWFSTDQGEVVEVVRSQLINEKAGTMTLGIFVALTLYAAIIMITLRNIYPQLLLAAYTLLASLFFCFIIFLFAWAYYHRKY